MDEGTSFECTEKISLLLKKRTATLTEEPREVPAMAVMGTDNGVPRRPVLLSEVPAVHGQILHRPRSPGSCDCPQNIFEA
jgi:hypothetical protein